MSPQSRAITSPFDPFAELDCLESDLTHITRTHKLCELDDDHPAHIAWLACRKRFFSETCNIEALQRDAIYVDVYAAEQKRWGDLDIVLVVWLGGGDLVSGYHEKIRNNVATFCKSNLPPKTYIRFYQLDASTFGSKWPRPTYPIQDAHPHSKVSYIGDSLGAAFKGRAGSIGAFVRLRDKKTGQLWPRQFAITCHHVVALLDTHKEYNRADDKETFKITSGAANAITVTSPAECDHYLTACNVLNLCKDSLMAIAAAEYLMQEHPQEEQEWLPHELKNRIKAAAQEVSVHKKQLDSFIKLQHRISHFDLTMGTVFWTSGVQYYKSEGDEEIPGILDVALVEMVPDRIGVNWIRMSRNLQDQLELGKFLKADKRSDKPNPSKEHKKEKTSKELIYELPGKFSGPVFAPNRSADMSVNAETVVLKYGRSSGLSCGRLTQREFFGRLPWPKYKQHQEWVVTSDDRDRMREVFSAGGDSGAVVFSQSGQAIGLLFGGGLKDASDDSSDCTFVTPWAKIADAIEEATGCTIEWETRSPSEAEAQLSLQAPSSPPKTPTRIPISQNFLGRPPYYHLKHRSALDSPERWSSPSTSPNKGKGRENDPDPQVSASRGSPRKSPRVFPRRL